jgi:RNA polymerase sigma factor (sigma-70 family)
MRFQDISGGGSLEPLVDWGYNHALLSGSEERAIDSDKWQALDGMLAVLMADDAGFNYFNRLLECSLNTPPELLHFERREHYFLLRRDLTELVGPRADSELLSEVSQALLKTNTVSQRTDLLASLTLPANLIEGIASVMLHYGDGEKVDSIGAALMQWMLAARPDKEADDTLTKRSIDDLGKWRGRYYAAKEKMILHNIRLVYKVAAKFDSGLVPYHDLVQEGVLGLIRAAEKFDYQKGYRFSTYSFNWITQAVRNCVDNKSGLIHHPANVRDNLRKTHNARTTLLAAGACGNSEALIVESTGLSKKKLRELQGVARISVSLDASVFDDGELVVGDKYAADTQTEPDVRLELSNLKRSLSQELVVLDEQEQTVIKARWGLVTGQPLSRGQLADQMDVSREWVRQLELSGLRKLSCRDGVKLMHKEHFS